MTQVRRLDTAPGAVEPVTADEFLAWARVTDVAETATAERLITVARMEVEQYTGHVLVPGTFALTAPAAYQVELPLVPVTAVSAIKSIDAGGVMTPLDPSTYAVLLTVTPALVRVPWHIYGAGGYEVTADAGYAADAVPADLKQAVMDVALLHYAHRDDPDLLTRVRDYLFSMHLVFGIVQV